MDRGRENPVWSISYMQKTPAAVAYGGSLALPFGFAFLFSEIRFDYIPP
jgi:hypothetical protein